MTYQSYDDWIALLGTYGNLRVDLSRAQYDQEVVDCKRADVRLAAMDAAKAYKVRLSAHEGLAKLTQAIAKEADL